MDTNQDAGTDLYLNYGVTSNKSSIAAVFRKITTKVYPYAFVNIDIDPSNSQNRYTLHVDGDGSKWTIMSMATQRCLKA